MAISETILQQVNRTPFVDTHEHLFEETKRLAALDPGYTDELPPGAPDFGLLFRNYANADLESAGMERKSIDRLFEYNLSPADKWKLLDPWYQKTRHTGYMQAIRETIRILYHEDDLRADNVESISSRIRDSISPGYYKKILLENALVEYTQVHSLDAPLFMETQYPELLCQDIIFKNLSSDLDLDLVLDPDKDEVRHLEDFHGVIDRHFENYGPRAIAVKNPSAYRRRLDYTQVSSSEAAPLFTLYLKDKDNLSAAEHKALCDHLFHYCVEKATEYDLPVKLHTGYMAHTGHMPLHRIRRNAGDLCELLQAHPGTKFVIMHITYPYQDEAIALAKHYPNAFIDMCWAWIINPMASIRFVKEFLKAVPANKLFTFGGDYTLVEMVPGHARMARQGLAQALSELVDGGWIEPGDVEELVERLMRGNAHEVFDYPGTLAQWAPVQGISC
jgi:predicted TIM-barrel fold metal-dependent hydrolase